MSDSSHSESSGSFWSTANIVIGGALALFAGYWSFGMLGGIIRGGNPLPEAKPVAAAPAVIGAATSAPAAASNEVIEITQKPDTVNPMLYATKEYTVKAGTKIKMTFDNSGAAAPQPHNVVISNPGTKDAMIAAGLSPESAGNGFIPKSPDVIAHTKTLQPGEKETIEFVLPTPGDYVMICTFPGHGMMMNGVIHAQ
ncbi:MAG: hypothetical protein H7A55_08180 [Verrucomicrobiaceae bacterium]|nr:hypothetical protein [Verrucomicrobiaceae bacterium]